MVGAMADLKFLGVNVSAGATTQKQGDPSSDALLLARYRPPGGVSGPFIIDPVLQVTGDNEVLVVEDGNSNQLLVLKATAGVGSVVLTGSATVSQNFTVNGNALFGDGTADTATFARAWSDNAVDFDYAAAVTLDPATAPSFGNDGTAEILIGSGTADPDVTGLAAPTGSLLLVLDGTAWTKTGAGATAWTQLATSVLSTLSGVMTGGTPINDVNVPLADPVIFRDNAVAGFDLQTYVKTSIGTNDAIAITMGAAATGGSAIDIDITGASQGVTVDSTTSTNPLITLTKSGGGGTGMVINVNAIAAGQGMSITHGAAGTGIAMSDGTSSTTYNTISLNPVVAYEVRPVVSGGGNGFNLTLSGGTSGTGLSDDGGDLLLVGGNGNVSGVDGDVLIGNLTTTTNVTIAPAGDITSTAGTPASGTGSVGSLVSALSGTGAAAGGAVAAGIGGDLSLAAGAGGASDGVDAAAVGGAATLSSGAGGVGNGIVAAAAGGAVTFSSGAGGDGGAATSTDGRGGAFTIITGASGTGGSAGERAGSLSLQVGASSGAVAPTIAIGTSNVTLITLGTAGASGNAATVNHAEVSGSAGLASVALNAFTTTAAGSHAVGVNVAPLTVVPSNPDLQATLEALDAAISGSNSLQEVYDNGRTITIGSVTETLPVNIVNTAQSTQDALTLSTDHNGAGDGLSVSVGAVNAQTGHGINVTKGAAHTGNAINLVATAGSSGDLINAVDTAAVDVFSVTAAGNVVSGVDGSGGAATFTKANKGGDLEISSIADFDILATVADTGAITFTGTSSGVLTGGNFSVSLTDGAAAGATAGSISAWTSATAGTLGGVVIGTGDIAAVAPVIATVQVISQPSSGPNTLLLGATTTSLVANADVAGPKAPNMILQTIQTGGGAGNAGTLTVSTEVSNGGSGSGADASFFTKIDGTGAGGDTYVYSSAHNGIQGGTCVSAAPGGGVPTVPASAQLLLESTSEVQIDAFDLDLNGTNSITIDVTANSGVAKNLTIGATNAGAGTGNLLLTADDEIDFSTVLVDINATGAVEINGAANSNFTATAGDLTLSTVTSGDMFLSSAAQATLQGDTTTAATPPIVLTNQSAFSGSAAAQVGVSVAHTIAQSSSAGMTSFDIDRTENTLGSGVQRFARFHVGATDHWEMFNDGTQTLYGNVSVGTDNTYSLGTSASDRFSTLWAATTNIGDLNLHGQEDDAHWTINESRDGVFLHDRKTGKVFKFLVEEVDPSVAPTPLEA
jgi:hypothetical protein